MSLHTELIREQACSEDLNKEIRMHIQEGRYDLAERRTADLMKSIKNMQQLQRRINEKKLLFEISLDLGLKGKLSEVVRHYEEAAR